VEGLLLQFLYSSYFAKFKEKKLGISMQCLFVIDSYVVNRGSSVSIVSGYGLDDRAIEVLTPAGAKRFFKTGSGAHPTSCTVGTRGPFLGAKARPGRDADHSPPSNAEVENEYELYILSP
jgi:hypothetical protein